jgi:hypothetical protein
MAGKDIYEYDANNNLIKSEGNGNEIFIRGIPRAIS